MRLSAKADALAVGVLVAIAVLVTTLVSMAYGSGRTLGALAIIMPGYTPLSVAGAVVGSIWGLVYGALAGWLHAVLYNVFLPEPVPGGSSAAHEAAP